MFLVQIKVEYPVYAVEGDGQDGEDRGGVLVPVDLMVLSRVFRWLPLLLFRGGGRKGVCDVRGGEMHWELRF